MKVKFKKLRENAVLPARATEGSGGWDVTVCDIEHKTKGLVVCYLGFALSFPENYKMTFVPRSSLTKTTYVLQNSPALGDSDYRGEYQLRFRGIPVTSNEHAMVYDEFPFNIGDKVGQLYLEEVIPIEWEETEDLDETIRGSGGFGHTGR